MRGCGRRALGGWVLALALPGIGCAPVPRGELARLQAQMDTVRAAADPLFDDLALAERRVGLQAATSPAIAASLGGPPVVPLPSGCAPRWIGPPEDGFLGALCPEHTVYESAIGDPPGTAALRRGLAVLVDATGALLALAENRDLAGAGAEVQGLATALAGFVEVAAAPFGPTSGAAAALRLLGPVAHALQPLSDQLLQVGNAARVRRLILDNEGGFAALIDGLRAAVPAMYEVFLADSEARIALAPRADRAALRAGQARTMRGWRRLLSDYDQLLAGAARSWRAVVAAAREPARADLSATRGALDDARAAAGALRRAQAAFRAGT